jgi:hypothetical protein
MTGQQFCTVCGKPNREQARFCGHCGQPLQATVSEKNTFLDESLQEEPEPLPITGDRSDEPSQRAAGGMTVKSLFSIILLIALLGLLAYTNPSLESYETFIRQQIIEESKTDLERALGLFFGGYASRFVASQTVRKDYVFLSTYDTGIGDEHLRTLGILNNFIILETPPSLKARNCSENQFGSPMSMKSTTLATKAGRIPIVAGV